MLAPKGTHDATQMKILFLQKKTYGIRYITRT